ncbi:MAG: MFS transporter [Lachnospiraceae bacterium]|nr:MFS transporter [Lachnospiraceae bacterium]
MKNYKKTKIACYLGFITQAIVANFAPLLFLKFHNDYNISLGNIALISTFFFLTQLLVDLFCAKFVDRIGYRTCIVASEVCSALGLIGLAFLPDLLPSPFAGIILSVIVYAIGSGLIEVLCSPIVEACPFENKEATMSLLHSFYCWGCVGTILLSTIFFFIFGMDSWKYLAVIFAIIPAVNIFNFATCPIEHLVEDGNGMGIKELCKTPLFWVAIILMICSGASELSMAQWASAYVEAALKLPKSVGDLAGPCMFAVTMGISRVIYGKFGEKMKLGRFMILSGILCLICYAFASFSIIPAMGLAGCVICGFSVGIMWPGTLSISSKKFPRGGTAMFALLAMAGDLGGSIGPGIVGRVTQFAGDNIQTGLRVGMVFPLILLLMVIIMDKSKVK